MAISNYGQNWMSQPGYSYYQAPMQQPQPVYQSYSPAPQYQQSGPGLQWVDGEVGAKAFQMPQGWPVGVPIALWDTNDQVIYLKSVNQMGMPNPLQKIRYSMEEQQTSYLPVSGTVSGTSDGNYATKEDISSLQTEMSELKELLKRSQTQRNQNGSNNGQQNRGVNQ